MLLRRVSVARETTVNWRSEIIIFRVYNNYKQFSSRHFLGCFLIFHHDHIQCRIRVYIIAIRKICNANFTIKIIITVIKIITTDAREVVLSHSYVMMYGIGLPSKHPRVRLRTMAEGTELETSAATAPSPKPHFVFPTIQDNPSGWGPCEVPEEFKDTPYQPFSKDDRLGKVEMQ